MTHVNGRLFFSASDGSSGQELWISDGTAQGTQLVHDINPGIAASQPSKITAFGGDAFFVATDPSGTALWRSDGTAAGTTLLKRVTPANASAGYPSMVGLGARLYFAGDEGIHGRELWTSDGTPQGTFLVEDLRPGPFGSIGNLNLMRAGPTLFFAAADRLNDLELWKLAPDVTPPAVLLAQFEFEQSLGVRITFSEPIDPATLTTDDLSILNLTTLESFVAEDIVLDLINTVAYFALPLALVDGDYRFSLDAGAVTDLAGNPLSTPLELQGPDVFVLAGDANRDRHVNLADFNILAANFGQSPRTFSQGDFNYDGVVNLADFNRLASRFGQILAPATTTDALTLGATGDVGQDDDDEALPPIL